MKTLIKIVIIGVICLGCKKSNEVESQSTKCDCKDFEIVNTQGYTITKGQVFFPIDSTYAYSVIDTEHLLPDYVGNFAICNDTSFINQLKAKHITDSSFVKVTSTNPITNNGKGVFCSIKFKDGSTLKVITVKIKTIDKL